MTLTLGPLEVLRLAGLRVQVQGIPRDPAEAWAEPGAACGRCGQPMGTRKQVKRSGRIEHKTCHVK